MGDYKQVKETEVEMGSKGRTTTFKFTQLIWLLLGILEGLLGLRFLLKLIGANPANAFASFLYKLTDVFLKPFQNLVGTPSLGRLEFEFVTLIAILVYGLLGWALERLVYLIFYKPRSGVHKKTTEISEPMSHDKPEDKE